LSFIDDVDSVPVMSNSPTCTVVTHADGSRCGAPAVYSWTTSRGATYHECAEHLCPGAVAYPVQSTTCLHPPTRTTKPFVLVRDGKIVGYAESASLAVQRRAARLGAAIVPVTR
jgi:hypothetical protein